jgi:apolipoprotein N-acyltransferase
VVYLFALVQLAKAVTLRRAFYSGLAVGLVIAVVRLEFFWRIFSVGAVALWVVYAFWIGLFVALGRLCLRNLGALASRRPAAVFRITGFTWKASTSLQPESRTPIAGEAAGLLGKAPRLADETPAPLIVALPFIWCGLEYFRSELYFLRFSWLNPGFAFGLNPQEVPLNHIGIYGVSLLLMSIACVAGVLWERSRLKAVAVLLAGVGGLRLWALLCGQVPLSPTHVHIAGVQMEFPTEKEVLARLNELVRKYPKTELVVLSEYTFGEAVPEKIMDWCHGHRRYLIVGGKEPTASGNFYNTAFVISPEGKIIFRQVKSVPIQFFKDGLPAPEQRVWESPWGKIGICICYDLSYSRVTDKLIHLGAQALIVPTMDVAEWGKLQHELHARVAPARAAEYGIPVFRLASSGISQAIDHQGRVLASAPCPGDGVVLSTSLELGAAGRCPIDRWLAPFATSLTGLFLLVFCVRAVRTRLRAYPWASRPQNDDAATLIL